MKTVVHALLLCTGLILAIVNDAQAHELSVAGLDIEYFTPTEAVVIFSAPSRQRMESSLPVQFQSSCQVENISWWRLHRRDGVQQSAYSLRCSEVQQLKVNRSSQLIDSDLNIILRVKWFDGEVERGLLSENRPSVAMKVRPESKEARATFFLMGAQHLLVGYDHLAFLLGLFLLVGVRRRLLWLVTSFTFGHALSLMVLVSYHFEVSARLIETLIALSVVIMALEVRHRGKVPMGAEGWAVCFGVLHGMGFSSAVRELGGEIHWTELLNFNLGIELAQVIVVLLFLVLAYAGQSFRVSYLFRAPRLSYGLGSIGCFAALRIWF